MLIGYARRAPSLPAPGSCRGQSSEGPFPDQLSFEFRQSREELEDQFSADRRPTKVLRFAAYARTLRLFR